MTNSKKLPTHSERLRNLENDMRQHAILIKDLTKTFNDHINYSKEWKQQLEIGNKEMKEMHIKIDKILNVRVNGRQGLEESLKDLYDLTKSQRANRKLNDAFKNWLATHNKLNFFIKSKLFKYVSYIIIAWFVFGMLQLIGLHIEFSDLVKFLSNIKLPGLN